MPPLWVVECAEVGAEDAEADAVADAMDDAAMTSDATADGLADAGADADVAGADDESDETCVSPETFARPRKPKNATPTPTGNDR